MSCEKDIYNNVGRRLNVMKKIIEMNIPENVFLSDLLYRPMDVGPFGMRGYSFYLYKKPDKTMGICLDKPTKRDIIKAITFILETWDENK